MQEERNILSDAPAGAGIMREFIPASPFARHVGKALVTYKLG